jgi:hypothetical protein
MKRFIDGDQMCFTFDDFVNLQGSPAVFIAIDDPEVQVIIREDSLYAASGEFLVNVRQQLAAQQGEHQTGLTAAQTANSNSR